MDEKVKIFLKDKMGESNYNKIEALDNEKLFNTLYEYINICNPDDFFVCTDSDDDISQLRKDAVSAGEEIELNTDGHSIHFDGINDQARDKAHTLFLFSDKNEKDPNLNYIERNEGLEEMHGLLKDIMKGHKLYICFFCLGPVNSDFSMPAVQLTDSPYVVHSETLLYRRGYEEFKRSAKDKGFFRFIHSEGEIENKVSKNTDKRRIYIDIDGETVYSANTQYGGNTIGLKKLAMRLAIMRSSKENWLTEHMFVMGVNGPSNRKTYLLGAFPSLCGKTSTSMMIGETIIGDDIAYLKRKNNKICAVNVECGMFGIINGVNQKDDPLIWNILHSPGEVIFSNILNSNGTPYWDGMEIDIPESGTNYTGEWTKGKKDASGNIINAAHKNARFTANLRKLSNVDPKLDDPEGVEVGGIIYGGRDSDTSVPVEESFDWTHGVITKGASLESETTAATLGQEGVRKFNLMSNLDFLSIPLAKYIQNNINFTKDIDKKPFIFSVNYFLKDKEGNWLNYKTDKAIWLKWMELRINGDVEAIKTPTGHIPKYSDLKRLFNEVQNKDYSEEDYKKQFTLRIPENLKKIERITAIYKEKVPNTPETLFNVLEEQKERLLKEQSENGDYVIPEIS